MGHIIDAGPVEIPLDYSWYALLCFVLVALAAGARVAYRYFSAYDAEWKLHALLGGSAHARSTKPKKKSF